MAQDRKQETPSVTLEFEETKSQNFGYVYANGVFGGLDPTGGRMTFYLDRFEMKTPNEPTPGAKVVKKIIRERQVEVNMSPTIFKSAALWMSEHVKRYEEMFGTIPMQPKEQKPPPDSMAT
jgi:hypothetical protein